MEKGKHKVTFLMPENLWREFSKKCIDEGKSRTDVFIELVKKYVERKI
jgi:metal-responsive CopG/Arc/MetJ family transcriptional regulator